MPPFNPKRVERAGARAAGALGRRSTPSELVGLNDRVRAAPGAGRRIGADLELARRAALDLLVDALEQERSAREAQEAAVEALRHLGGYSPSWTALGELLGISGQAAHKRLRHVEQPEPQTTIDDELERVG